MIYLSTIFEYGMNIWSGLYANFASRPVSTVLSSAFIVYFITGILFDLALVGIFVYLVGRYLPF